MEITEQIAATVLTVVDAGLVSGMGEPVPGQMCVEAAVCYAMGLPHSDNPTCVSPALRRFKIRLNDASWSSPAARAAGMRRLALVQLGSAGVLDDREFARRVAEMTIRTVVPVALRAAARRAPAHAAALEAAAVRCEREGTEASAREARAAAAYAADAAAAYAAYAAAAYAAAAAADAYAAAAAADAYAAAAAADAAAAAAAYAADAITERDRVLADFAERVVQILIAMDAPGCRWLSLAPEVV
jgi:hypothetical protein